MKLKQLVQTVQSRWSGRSIQPPAGVYSPRIFRGIIARERARVDRNAHALSLVVFQVHSVSRQRQETRQLVEELSRRIRFTDVIGCLDTQRIGVLLPETAGTGAVKFARDIQRGLERNAAAPRFNVYTYPTDEIQDIGDDDPRQLWLDSLSPELPRSEPAAAPRVEQTRSQRSGSTTPPRVVDELRNFSAQGIPPWKRALDVIGAALALAVLSPLFLALTLLIKLVSPGPVFYRQKRIGFLGREFDCWKFRTMHVGADAALHQQHIQQIIPGESPLRKLDERDPRIIPFGRFLRAVGLDELPQLVNVLRGDMSLIGPRPDVPYAVEKYSRWNIRRFDSVPGLTGLWQVSGKNRTTHTQMMRLDIKYGQSRSPWMDFRIFARTFPAIWAEVKQHFVRGRGLSRPDPNHT